jgi:hypothetical protein
MARIATQIVAAISEQLCATQALSIVALLSSIIHVESNFWISRNVSNKS